MKLYLKPIFLVDDAPGDGGGGLYPPGWEGSGPGGDPGGEVGGDGTGGNRSLIKSQPLDQVLDTLSVGEPEVEVMPEVTDIVPEIELPTVDIPAVDIPME